MPERDPSKLLRFPDAFTLLETLLVLFIFSIMLGLATPRFIGNDINQVRHAAIRFQNIVQWLNEQATNTGKTYRLAINLAEQKYESLVLAGDEFEKVKNQLTAETQLDPQTVRMKWAADDGDFVQSTEIAIDFSPLGPKKPVLAHFSISDAPKEGFSVLFIPGQLKPKILAGIKTWRTIENSGSSGR